MAGRLETSPASNSGKRPALPLAAAMRCRIRRNFFLSVCPFHPQAARMRLRYSFQIHYVEFPDCQCLKYSLIRAQDQGN
jgi:hypothetical protein